MPQRLGTKLLPHCSHRAKTSECVDKRETHKVFDYSIPRLNEGVVWTHKGCVCNEKVALRERHQLDTGARYTANKSIVQMNMESLVFQQGEGFPELTRSSFGSVISHYSGAKRKEYERGAASLLVDPLNLDLDARIRMFLKDDKYHQWDFKAPRCIQFRNKRYGICLASYLQPIEEFVYQLKDISGTRVFAKGRNLSERANDLRAKWENFTDPIALCLDHSKFDCHVGVELLKQEHAFYESFYPGDRKLRGILRAQLVNKGSTRNGTTFKTKGTRMSGDQNTGLGNSALNYGMLCEYVKGVEATFYIDGDDSVVIVERADVHKLDIKCFAQFGMTTKLEIAEEFERVDFCQGRPVFDGVSWHMVRDPFRVLARLPWVVKRNHLPIIPRYVKSVGMCELALNMGIPVLQSVACALIEFGSGAYVKTDRHYLAKLSKIKPWHARAVPISQVTRESFERAWGISVEEQLELETVTLEKPMVDVLELLFSNLPAGVTL